MDNQNTEMQFSQRRNQESGNEPEGVWTDQNQMSNMQSINPEVSSNKQTSASKWTSHFIFR